MKKKLDDSALIYFLQKINYENNLIENLNLEDKNKNKEKENDECLNYLQQGNDVLENNHINEKNCECLNEFLEQGNDECLANNYNKENNFEEVNLKENRLTYDEVVKNFDLNESLENENSETEKEINCEFNDCEKIFDEFLEFGNESESESENLNLLNLLNFIRIKKKLNFETMDTIIKFINIFDKEKNLKVKNIYQFKKKLNINNKNIKKYYICYQCNQLQSKNICSCTLNELQDFILYQDIKQQINDLLINYNLIEKIEKFYEKIKKNKNLYELGDFYLSENFVLNENEIYYILNTDGICVKSNNIWPIFIQILNLDVNERNKKENILLPILFFKKSKNKFNFDLITKLLFEDLKILKINGLQIKQKNYKFKLFKVVCDLGARHKLLNIKQFNSYDGCPYCEQHGEYYSNKIIYPDLIFKERIQDQNINNFKIYLDFKLNKEFIFLDFMHLILEGFFI
jgi:uncharacterized CHY-type Zn-finger protein